MIADQLHGLQVALVDPERFEVLRFHPGQVSATLGSRSTALCASVLSLEVLDESTLRIHGEGVEIVWSQIELGPEALRVLRNGRPAEYRFEPELAPSAPIAKQSEQPSLPRSGFHLSPIYLVFLLFGLLALFWDWRALIGLAALLLVAKLLIAFENRRQASGLISGDVRPQQDGAGAGSAAESASALNACPSCGKPLFVVEPGRTTAAEIKAFASRAQGWCENPEAIAGWMPPGQYCANGCFAVHSSPAAQAIANNGRSERLPPPARIVLADVLRDGGSYRLDYESTWGEFIEVNLPVKIEGKLRRVGYYPPQLRRQPSPGSETTDPWTLDWDEAAALAALLRPLLSLSGDIQGGNAERAREMLRYLGLRGELAR
ncbi:hypothetical protein [Pseudomarimonas arenosa]|uniref:Uncharacterized protein n=1 Tax=Pseudomarimonas arenosa TaxID=2774145 RepID=A0AAW3ZMK5_9GAMM|nr:hypothetical protein [Pseudomarimonas arenosa]MBD8526404.1 hypothetical protein [Pseudomarimonas arenosa]